ncbi:hypothetical protein OUZ56_032388 [Daphnia magna]|uniref:Dual specificity protein phosphatase n=1 Tax=Daphnia magna TaxID=35525 RepID=A0ABR0B8S5_9CRUS|nr:hypothetical protein OUZ56_032388 [Daphnia magna]
MVTPSPPSFRRGRRPAIYDVVVAGADGAVGVLRFDASNPKAIKGFRELAAVAPRVDALAPGSITTQFPQTFSVQGAGGDACKVPVTVAGGLGAGDVCVVRLTNADGSYVDYSALGVTNPSLNLNAPRPGGNLVVGGRGLGFVALRPRASARFLYAVGGDDGTSGGVLGSVEAASVDPYGAFGAFALATSSLARPRAFAGTVALGRYVYVIGGRGPAGTEATVERALALSPREVPRPDAVDIALHRQSRRRVAPERSDLLKLPANGTLRYAPTLTWLPPVDRAGAPLPDVTGYRIYRTAVDGLPGTETLLATVAGTSFVDDGTQPLGAAVPVRLGALGPFATLASLGTPREALGVAAAFDPNAAGKAYVYALFGKTAAGLTPATYEFLPLTVTPGGHQTPAAAWTAGTQNLGLGRYGLGAFVAGSEVLASIPSGDRYIYAGAGLGAGDLPVNDFRAGKIGANGELTVVDVLSDPNGTNANYGALAVNGQLFMIGGGSAAPSGGARSGAITTAPQLANNAWNAGALNLIRARASFGLAQESAFVFAGGRTDEPSVASKTTDCSDPLRRLHAAPPLVGGGRVAAVAPVNGLSLRRCRHRRRRRPPFANRAFVLLATVDYTAPPGDGTLAGDPRLQGRTTDWKLRTQQLTAGPLRVPAPADGALPVVRRYRAADRLSEDDRRGDGRRERLRGDDGDEERLRGRPRGRGRVRPRTGRHRRRTPRELHGAEPHGVRRRRVPGDHAHVGYRLEFPAHRGAAAACIGVKHSMTDPIVHLRSFSLKYRRKTVLASIDLDVFRGEPHVLIGPVAAGKSSLLRSLAGLHADDATIGGTALIAGTPISEVNRGLIVGQRAATLMGSLRDCLAPREAGGAGVSLSQRNARAEEALERFGLRHLAGDLDTPVLALSAVDARLVLLAHFAAAAPPVLALDEPTAGMSHADVFRYCAAVRLVAQRIPLVVATHHQITARELGGTISLLAGGRIVESRATAAFFEAPLTETGRQYVRTGSCPSPSPDAPLEEVDPELRARFPELFGPVVPSSSSPPAPQKRRPASLQTPAPPFTTAELAQAFEAPSHPPPAAATPTKRQISRGTALVPRLHPIWVHEERPPATTAAARFGGCRRPGLLAPLAEDLWDLREAGVDVLISLEAEHDLATAEVEAASIEHRSAPFADMHAPAAHDMIDLCITLDGLFAAGKSVCVHCRAGLGRTGTVLAAYLLWKGHSVDEALQKIRAKEPKFVSTETQERFLRALAEAIGDAH